MSDVGMLPALGSGLGELAATGQVSRLVDGYFRPYAAAFGGVRYFSYLPERLEEFTQDADLLARVRVLAPPRRVSRARRALTLVSTHAADLSACAALRVFQITGTLPAVIARARLGVPYVTTYGFWYARLSKPGPTRLAKAIVERVGLARAAAVIATTPELAARAARVARRVELIPNGVDTAAFAPPAAGRAGRRGPRRVLYVGRLSAEKNLSTVVTAVAKLDARLVFVGGGPLEARLREEARAAGVQAEFRGVVDQRALPAVYAEADAFVLASFTEGHPKVLLEAMSAGLPCVASACDGNRSLVADGATGLLFDPHRPDELADALARVLGDAALASRLGADARALIVSRYDLAATVAREIALVRDVAGLAQGVAR
ncbi:MAG TPA: glycosyltransferase family 4 protein [Methylomirabilota bacterium]|nr:glycosyltransferase family 4 protein [Methylomirabilota bacterium]